MSDGALRLLLDGGQGPHCCTHTSPYILYQGCPVCEASFRKLLRISWHLRGEHHVVVSDPVTLDTRIRGEFPRKEQVSNWT
jgi:hypothetical protein